MVIGIIVRPKYVAFILERNESLMMKIGFVYLTSVIYMFLTLSLSVRVLSVSNTVFLLPLLRGYVPALIC